jgi:MAE_28990/MAE_18760-like HEPN
VPARSADDLGDILDQALAWRRVEMHSIKSALQDALNKSEDSPLTRALARSCVAMTYAHWEGYTKEACEAYVKYVTRRRLKCSEINDGFLMSTLKHLHRRANSGDEAAALALIEVVRRPNEARVRIPPSSTLVDTKSNLRFETFRTIFGALGLSVADFETKANLVDRSLCDIRNAVAHGRDAFPPAEDALVLYEEVIKMMESVRDQILAAARGGDYRARVGSDESHLPEEIWATRVPPSGYAYLGTSVQRLLARIFDSTFASFAARPDSLDRRTSCHTQLSNWVWRSLSLS